MNYAKLIIFTAIFASTTVHASSVICPPTVKAGKPLIVVSAEFTNSDCEKEIIITNLVLTLLGSSGTTTSATLGLQGPFVTPYNSIIHHADCSSNPITEVPLKLTDLVVIKKVPVSMKGKLAVVDVRAMDENNRLVNAGQCQVPVTN